MSHLLDIRGVTKAYKTAEGPLPVLRGITLGVAQGTTLALTGESGSGKSTLLHLTAALDHPDTGTISIDGTNLAGLNDGARGRLRRDKIGLIFQQFNLIPSLTVAQNIAFQARLAGRFEAEFTQNITARLGLNEMLDRYPENLSGGQQQRVAIARALAPQPPLILADEPTGNLDETTADTVVALLLELVEKTEAALMMVTHSNRLAAKFDRRAHLSHGQLAVGA